MGWRGVLAAVALLALACGPGPSGPGDAAADPAGAEVADAGAEVADAGADPGADPGADATGVPGDGTDAGDAGEAPDGLDDAPDAPEALADAVAADVPADALADAVAADVPADVADSSDTVPADVPADAPADAPDPARDFADLGAGVSLRPATPLPGGSAVVRYAGALADRSALFVHLGFNGWNAVPGLEQQVQDDGTGNLDHFQDLPMTRVGDGFEIALDMPADARALHMAFFAPRADGGRDWDNRGTDDWNQGVGRPYAGPWLYFNDAVVPGTGIVVGLATGHVCTAAVRYGTGAAPDRVAVEPEPGRHHAIVLSGLVPGSTYRYAVSCPGAADAPPATFRTPAAGATRASFLVLGDVQDTLEHDRWARTLTALLAGHGDADFLLAVGDLAWNDKPGLWWTFFDRSRDLLATIPVLPLVGNHDTTVAGGVTSTARFQRFFDLGAPGGYETIQSVVHGPLQVVTLDSEYPDGFVKDTGGQYRWLEAVLAGGRPAPWTFVAWHRPPYSVALRHLYEQYDYRDITALLDGRVDWCFGGHDHLYQRMKPLRHSGTLATGSYGTGPEDGVGYLVVPPAGSWPEGDIVGPDHEKAHFRDRLAWPVPAPDSGVVDSELGFVRVDVDGDAITLTTWGLGTSRAPRSARVVDRVSYVRPPAAAAAAVPAR